LNILGEGGTNTFTNAGTFRQTVTTSTTTFGAVPGYTPVAFSNSGTVDIQTGTVDLAGAFSNFSGSILTGGTYLVTGTLQFNNANIATNAATVVLNGTASRIIDGSGNDALKNFATNASTGGFTIQNGRNFTAANAAFTNAGTLAVGASSTFTAPVSYTQTGGVTVLNGGMLAVPTASSLALQGGVLASESTGTVQGSVNNSGGTVAPGGTGAAGQLTISGNYTQASAGTLNIDIGGDTSGTRFDQVNISGAAALGGTMNTSFLNGFVPNPGDSFPVLNYGSYSAGFDQLTNNTFGNHQSLEPVYSTTSLNLVTTLFEINVSPTSGLTTTQAGGTAQFQVFLSAQPTADVTIGIQSSDTTQGTVSTSSLTFTPQNWNAPQTVTITGVDDGIIGPDTPYLILIAPAVSADPNFNGLVASDVSVTNLEEDTRDLQVTGLQTTPGLQSGSNVTIQWSDADIGNVAVTGSFTDAITVTNLTTGQTLVTATVPYDASTRGPIAGGSSAVQQYSFTLPAASPGAGQIQISVTTNSNNAILERNSTGTAQSNNSATIIVSSALAAPDLQVTGLTTSPTSPQSGNTVTVQWNDSNTGNLPALGSFTDRVTVINTTTGQTLVSFDVPYDASARGNLAAGASAAQQFAFRLPDGNPGVGSLQVSVTTDEYNTIVEANSSGTGETNNTTTLTETSTLAPYADLVVQSGSLSVSPSSLQSGAQVQVLWSDQNIGAAAVSAGFSDSVLAQRVNADNSLTTIASGTVVGNVTLAAGASSPESFSFTLPNGSAGTGTILITVTTDSGQTVKEYDSNGNPAYGNNSASMTVTSSLALYPDLQVTNLTVNPATPVSGGTVTINWNDANTGNAGAATSFYDHVTVTNTSTGLVVASGDVYYDASASGFGPIAANASAARSFQFTLPNGTPGIGNLSVTVTADFYNQVFEVNSSGTGESNNSAIVTATSVAAPYPDLQVQNLAVSPTAITSGGTIQVSWDDANTGNAPVDAAFVDSLTIVNNTTGATLLSTSVGYDPTQPGHSPIAPGSSQHQTYSFTLPHGLPGVGNLTFTVKTDAANQIFEYNASGTGETNNIASLTETSQLASYPDLSASDASAVSTASPGQQVSVGWTLANNGAASASGPWTEQVLLATDAAGDNPTLLTAQTFSGSLSAGQPPVARSANVQVPDLPAGNYWFVVSENPFGEVFELIQATIWPSPPSRSRSPAA